MAYEKSDVKKRQNIKIYGKHNLHLILTNALNLLYILHLRHNKVHLRLLAARVSVIVNAVNEWDNNPYNPVPLRAPSPIPRSMGLLPDTENCGCACAGNAGNIIPASGGKRSRHISRHVRDARAVMHDGIANYRFPMEWTARNNVSDIPGACATRNDTYLVRDPWLVQQQDYCRGLYNRHISPLQWRQP